jgi:hypothetical protein
MTHDDHTPVSIDRRAARAPVRGSILVRLGWMLFGPLAMMISVMGIVSLSAWTFGLRDLVFWAAAVLSGTLKYMDVTRHHGETAAGRPATKADFWRYLAGLAGTSVALWVLAQAIQL